MVGRIMFYLNRNKEHVLDTVQHCTALCRQRGIVPLPKSVTPERIRENARVYDFAISQEDMAVLTGMPPTATSHDPDEIDF